MSENRGGIRKIVGQDLGQILKTQALNLLIQISTGKLRSTQTQEKTIEIIEIGTIRDIETILTHQMKDTIKEKDTEIKTK